MTNPYQPGPIAGGMHKLVAALAGGDEIQAGAQSKAQMAMYQMQAAQAGLDKKITDAYSARDIRNNRLEVPGAIDAAFPNVDPAVRGLMAALSGGDRGADIPRIQQGAIRAQLPAMREEEGFSPANALASAFNPKPMENVKISGGHILGALYGDAPTIQQTDKEAAAVETQEARADTVRAQTEGVQARTEATRDRMNNPGKYRAPSSGGGKGGGKGGRGTERERAIAALAEAEADGYDVTGLDARDVLDSWNRTGDWKPRRKNEGPGEIRVIGSKGARDLPSGKRSAPSTPVKPPATRVKGKTYNTPKGPMVWTGTGWKPAS